MLIHLCLSYKVFGELQRDFKENPCKHILKKLHAKSKVHNKIYNALWILHEISSY